MHFKSRLDVKFYQSQWSMKCRSRAQGHCEFLKSATRTIVVQGFILAATTLAKKYYLFLVDMKSTRLNVKLLTKSVEREM